MAIKDNFGNPKGVIGKLMLSGMNWGHTPMAKWAFTQFDVPAEGNIVDIGCGGGFNIKRLLDKSANGMVYGVDISDVSVEKSKAVNKRHIGRRCEVYKGSADELPFKDNFIDLATAFETVYFWKDMSKCFAEIKRVLKEGGKFIIVNDPGDPDKRWEEMIPNMTSWKSEELGTYMREAGFIDVQIIKNKFMFGIFGTKQY